MKEHPLVSIIVPVYNGGEYLRPCLDSVIRQTYTAWELILVDDGSTDGSSDVCDEYARRAHISVIHKQNEGQAVARNVGLKNAKGIFVSFIDCDDWLEPETYEEVIKELVKQQADALIYGYFKEYTTSRKTVNNDGTLSVYDGQDAVKMILEGKVESYFWSMIFRKSILQEPIPNMRFFEDHAVIFKWVGHAEKVVVFNKPYYHYRQLEGSSMHSSDVSKEEQYFSAIKERYTYAVSHMKLPGWETKARRQYLHDCIKLAKDLVRTPSFGDYHRHFLNEVKAEIGRFQPISRQDVDLKSFLRIKILLANEEAFIRTLRLTSLFSGKKSHRNLFELPSEKTKIAVSQAEKPRIVFLISRFLDGGIDMVLVDYLHVLATAGRYQIKLAIEQNMGDLEVFLTDIPKEVEVVHLIDKNVLMKWRRQKITRRLSLSKKLVDESMLSPIRRRMISYKLKKLARNSDVIIDFDTCSYSFLEHIHTKKVAWFHFSFEEMMKSNHRRMMRIGHHLEYYDKVITISKAMYEEGVRLFPRLEDKFDIIYNAKDRGHLLYQAEETVDDPRIKEPYILAVERLEESQKDISTLLRAYQMLKQEYHHEEKLYLLGKGQSEEELKKKAETLGISNDVVFLGFHSNPYPWIKNARLLAHSAKMEGLPTVLIEGLMLNKLIVSTDCPTGPREILNDGKAGLLVPVGDANAMAEAVHRMLTERELQEETLEQLKLHRQHFMFEETERMFYKMIKEVLKK